MQVFTNFFSKSHQGQASSANQPQQEARPALDDQEELERVDKFRQASLNLRDQLRNEHRKNIIKEKLNTKRNNFSLPASRNCSVADSSDVA